MHDCVCLRDREAEEKKKCKEGERWDIDSKLQTENLNVNQN